MANPLKVDDVYARALARLDVGINPWEIAAVIKMLRALLVERQTKFYESERVKDKRRKAADAALREFAEGEHA